MPRAKTVGPPSVVVLGGPNGAGKSTAAPRLLRGALRVDEFVSVDLALARVKLRVEGGGHDVPAATIRRRFERGRINFFERYLPLADRWRVYDASAAGGPTLIAAGQRAGRRRIVERDSWERVTQGVQ